MITLGILTRDRPAQLRICLESARDTAKNKFRTVLLYGDDYAGYNSPPRYNLAPMHVFLSTPRMFYYADLRLLYQHMHEVTDLDLFVISNDDCEFMVGGWDKSAEEQLYEEFDDGMGVLSFWEHPFHTFMSRAKLFDEQYDGVLAPEDYVFYFGDSERHDDLLERDQWMPSDPPLVKHPIDAVHNDPTKYPFCWYERDKRLYLKRNKEREYTRGLEKAINDMIIESVS